MTMERGDAWLKDLADRMKQESDDGNVPISEVLTVREFVGRFGYLRRGTFLVSHGRERMEELKLRTNPDFEYTYPDAKISVETVQEGDETRPDPTPRIEMLDVAHRRPRGVNPDDLLCKATTMMQMHDYSQLPVMQSKFNLKGVVTWQSIGARQAHGQKCETVKDCMVPAQEVPIATPLFETIDIIVKHGYVLVRGSEKSITGIVTASDLSNQFFNMAGPFMLIREIEEHVRHLVHRKFRLDTLQGAAYPPERASSIRRADDLTLGEYYNLLNKPQNWEKLKLNIDRSEFGDCLKQVNRIRNDVMHFRPDGLEDDDLQMLRDVARFFENRLG